MDPQTARRQPSDPHKEERLSISEKAAELLSRLPHRTPRALGHCRDAKRSELVPWRGSQRSGWVFRSPYEAPNAERDLRTWGSSMSRAFRQYRDKAGVREELDFHALRKGFCSELARKGASAHVIKRAARHASIQTSLRYVELYDDTIRSELDGMF